MKKTAVKTSCKKQFFLKEDTILHNIKHVKNLFSVIFLIFETSHLNLLFSY